MVSVIDQLRDLFERFPQTQSKFSTIQIIIYNAIEVM
jgi:hypothetical protein